MSFFLLFLHSSFFTDNSVSWEYPGNQGIGCNVVQGADTADFLATIQQLRSTSVGKNLILTAAVATPFVDANGVQMTDLSGFAEALDWIEIMNYDVRPLTFLVASLLNEFNRSMATGPPP